MHVAVGGVYAQSLLDVIAYGLSVWLAVAADRLEIELEPRRIEVDEVHVL